MFDDDDEVFRTRLAKSFSAKSRIFVKSIICSAEKLKMNFFKNNDFCALCESPSPIFA